MHELIICAVGQKYTDLALETAKNAGATGGTLLHTASVGNKQIEQQMGTVFREETDTIAILTTTEYRTKIMEALRDAVGLKTEGGAVIFSLPVNSIVGIGKSEEEEQ